MTNPATPPAPMTVSKTGLLAFLKTFGVRPERLRALLAMRFGVEESDLPSDIGDLAAALAREDVTVRIAFVATENKGGADVARFDMVLR